MRKNAWVICCCTAVLSAFGIFFRWLQDQACFEAETGLAVHGSIWPYVVALMIAVAAAVLAVVCFRVKNQPHTSFPDTLPAAFAASKRARAVGGVLLGAMLALALTGVSLSGLLLLAGLYIFFSVAVKIRPHRLRSILVFALYGVSAAVFYSLHGEGALALGCGMIAVTGVLRHTRRFCVPEDEKPRISNSEF